MRTVVTTLLAVVILAATGSLTFIYAGVHDVAPTDPHWPITYWAMDTLRVHSVKLRARGIFPPPDLASDARVLEGAEHFAAHCASCHGAPGVPAAKSAKGFTHSLPIFANPQRPTRRASCSGS